LSSIVYCEMCGAPVDRSRIHIVSVEGSTLRVCDKCYSKIMFRGASSITLTRRPPQQTMSTRSRLTVRQPPQPSITSSSTVRRRVQYEKYELVEDYAQRIREARERLGWSHKVLAMKVKESETTIKRIESGKLRPTIELARRLEEVLGIKLLVPAVDEEISSGSRSASSYVTLGEIVNIRRSEE